MFNSVTTWWLWVACLARKQVLLVMPKSPYSDHTFTLHKLWPICIHVLISLSFSYLIFPPTLTKHACYTVRKLYAGVPPLCTRVKAWARPRVEVQWQAVRIHNIHIGRKERTRTTLLRLKERAECIGEAAMKRQMSPNGWSGAGDSPLLKYAARQAYLFLRGCVIPFYGPDPSSY